MLPMVLLLLVLLLLSLLLLLLLALTMLFCSFCHLVNIAIAIDISITFLLHCYLLCSLVCLKELSTQKLNKAFQMDKPILEVENT